MAVMGGELGASTSQGLIRSMGEGAAVRRDQDVINIQETWEVTAVREK